MPVPFKCRFSPLPPRNKRAGATYWFGTTLQSMRHICTFSLLAALLAISARAAAADDAPAFDAQVRPVLNQFCLSCHGPEKKKGDLDLTHFQPEKAGDAKDVWQEVAARLAAREMPPEKKPQPSEEQRLLVVHWVEKTVGLSTTDCQKIASDETQRFYRGYVMSRRLNRTEYSNTIGDLFGLDLHPGDDLPEDGSGGEGFNTDGNALFISSIQIEKYLQSADKVVRAALATDAARKRILIAAPGQDVSPRDAARQDIAAFARRAFRRPVSDSEVDRLLTLFDRAQGRGDSFEASIRLALKSILISPNFLFLVEPEQEADGIYQLADYPLASRLSYFLWSSMPDDELFKLAEAHRLGDPEVLRQQVRRMLQDPRSQALGENFGCQWLGIDDLGITVRPDSKQFPMFDDDLAAAMHEEAVEFVNSVLRDDRSLVDLLDADYTFLNGKLARHYGIDGINGREMRKVTLSDRNRGGVLGLGAVLTATSYPLRTSPVLRGKWVLEQLLGERVPPPPPDVGKLRQDDKQIDGLTFRQQLERHRTQAECAACHRKMDPLGFGLENFDAVGRWRDTQRGAPVDAGGELPSGEKFAGPAELRQVLLKRQDEFLGNFCRKMLGYALGRGLNRFDQCVVEDAMKALKGDGNRSSALIETIVLSKPFRYRYSKK
jgi:mono/diheme cytochrome c family protein